jgi:hypothetical protein
MSPSDIKEPEWVFPFEGMCIGDSFFIPTLQPTHMIYVVDTRAKIAGVRVRAFTSQKEGHLGVRVWRIR